MRRTVAAIATLAVSISSCASPLYSARVERTPSQSPVSVTNPQGQEIALGNESGELAFTEDSIWITSVAELIRVDRRSLRIVKRIDLGTFDSAFLGGGADIAATPEGIWVVCACTIDDDPRFPKGAAGGVVLIDPETNRSLRKKIFTGRIPTAVAVDDSSVWLSTDDGVTRLDRKSLKVRSTTRLGRYVGDLVLVGDSLWTTAGDPDDEQPEYIVRIDAISGRIAARIAMSERVIDTVATEAAIWAVTHDSLHRVDPVSARITASLTLTQPGSSVAVGGGSIWVTSFHEGVLTRIDEKTLETVSTWDVGTYPSTVAVYGDSIWVVNYTPGTLRRISL